LEDSESSMLLHPFWKNWRLGQWHGLKIQLWPHFIIKIFIE
jgi:hypothetical protein